MGLKFKKVAVLKGGISSERDVALRSGAAIAGGLRDGGFDVLEIDITEPNFSIPSDIEAVFVALHGTFGEDGEIQTYLEKLKIPYTGSGPASCATAFDKIKTRECLIQNGVPVAQGEVIQSADQRTLPLPVVIKPPREGSSVGCHLIQNESDWESAFADTQSYSEDVLVETYIPGKELTVGIVDGEVLPVVEIDMEATWFDYEAKYVTKKTNYIVPANLDDTITTHLQFIAMNTFKSLNADGFGRVDFRLTPEGDMFVLELNSIPGFTETSLLPKAAQAAGIGFSDLCCRIMNLAHL